MNGARRKSWPRAATCVIIACGPLLGRAMEAGRQLREQGIGATVISNPFVNRVDVEDHRRRGQEMLRPRHHH